MCHSLQAVCLWHHPTALLPTCLAPVHWKGSRVHYLCSHGITNEIFFFCIYWKTQPLLTLNIVENLVLSFLTAQPLWQVGKKMEAHNRKIKKKSQCAKDKEKQIGSAECFFH